MSFAGTYFGRPVDGPEVVPLLEAGVIDAARISAGCITTAKLAWPAQEAHYLTKVKRPPTVVARRYSCAACGAPLRLGEGACSYCLTVVG